MIDSYHDDVPDDKDGQGDGHNDDVDDDDIDAKGGWPPCLRCI